MKEKGFTLIELISTIVILGIVFTIVSVLVLGIVRSAKENAKKRNIDLYGKMVETAMAEYQSQNLKYPDKFEDLTIEYTGPKVECDISRINPDHTLYLDECKVNNKKVSNYHYGNLVLTDQEYVDKLGENIEKALKDYHNEHNNYPINYRLLDLPELDKDVNCVSEINPDGTVYLTNCSVDGEKILADNTEDGYYHYGESLTAVKYLLKKTNSGTITNYTDGDTHEMYTFEHEATEQTPTLTDYRYIGSEPYNYVSFNNELWRIIGVFSVEDENDKWEERIKLIKNDRLSETMAYHTDDKVGWKETSLCTYLNNDYLNSLGAKNLQLVSNLKYYLGAEGLYGYGNASFFYNFERSNIGYSIYETNWIGKIGLMYASDQIYTYGKNIDDICFNSNRQCSNGNKSWLYSMSSRDKWVMDVTNHYAYQYFFNNGVNIYNFGFKSKFSIYPTLYLLSKVKITSGDGSVDNPYQLSL